MGKGYRNTLYREDICSPISVALFLAMGSIFRVWYREAKQDNKENLYERETDFATKRPERFRTQK
jgi:hypothetical protein